MKVRQVVQVEIMGAMRPYTYAWYYDPILGELPLALGDRVELPPNQVQEEGSSGKVCRLGSDYSGDMKAIVRKIERPAGRPRIGNYRFTETGPGEMGVEKWPDEDEKWAGFGQGDYS